MTRTGYREWDLRVLDLARHIASWSKDPSTQCGAVIVRTDKSIVSTGFNGFAMGMNDAVDIYADRATKYDRVIHAEMNAIIFARESIRGCILYTWPFLTCHRCAVHVIQSGITSVIAPSIPPDKEERWGDALVKARSYYREAGVHVSEMDIPDRLRQAA